MEENNEIVIKGDDRSLVLKNQNLTSIVLNVDSVKLTKQITNFNASNNQISQMSGMWNFQNLIVLNLSHNMISEIEGCNKLLQLRALVMNNNKITKIQGLEKCLEINTIVLSNNQLSSIDGISHLSKLTKLSISHNQISVQHLEYLVSGKLINDNKIREIPSHFSAMTRLRILDIGKNEISKVNSILILQNLKLINLNVLGNPCSDKAVSLAVKFPRIRIVNNIAAEKALENHKSKIPIKIQENTENKKKKISQPVQLYEIEKEIDAPTFQKPQKSVIVKVEKISNKQNKWKKRAKQINLNQQTQIEKW